MPLCSDGPSKLAIDALTQAKRKDQPPWLTQSVTKSISKKHHKWKRFTQRKSRKRYLDYYVVSNLKILTTSN